MVFELRWKPISQQWRRNSVEVEHDGVKVLCRLQWRLVDDSNIGRFSTTWTDIEVNNE